MNRTALCTLGVAVLALLPCGAAAQYQVRVESKLVLVDALVLNRTTRTPVPDLTRSDFAVREEGKAREVSHFSRDELPLSIVLLLDVSGSVQPVLDEVQRSAREALSRLKKTDRVALMAFGSVPVLMTGLTSDQDVIADRLEAIYSQTPRAGMATFIGTAAYEATRYLRRNTAPEERRVIVIITDDEDTSYGHGAPRGVVLRNLNETGTTLCAITVGRPSAPARAARLVPLATVTAINPPLGAAFLASRLLFRVSHRPVSAGFLAERSGGLTLHAKDEEVGPAFVGMMELLRSRYTLGYVPDDGAKKGLRKIEVELKPERREAVVLARNSYFVREGGVSR